MTTRKPAPAVSIGLPVYNGERYLPETIGWLLSQTYRDFELIICDDASNDRTERICREYAARDPRIRYYRGVRHIGATENFNRTFLLSHGRYFKWAAMHDSSKPQLLEECVRALEADPCAAMAFSGSKSLDSDCNPNVADNWQRDTSSPSAVRRYRALIFGQPGGDAAMSRDIFFGLYRRSVLSRTNLIDPVFHNKIPLQVRCALLGRFIRVESTLVLNRDEPPARSQRRNFSGDPLEMESAPVGFGPEGREPGAAALNGCLTAREYLLAISQTPLSPMQKRLCRFWWAVFVARNARTLFGEVLQAAGSRFLASDLRKRMWLEMNEQTQFKPILSRTPRSERQLESPFPRAPREMTQVVSEEAST